MRWVFDNSFVGIDRRHRRSLRLHERRQLEAVGPPPPMPTALRQLKLAAFEVDDASLLRFSYHVSSVAMLATAFGRDDVARSLQGMVEFLATPSDRRDREERVSAFLREAETILLS